MILGFMLIYQPIQILILFGIKMCLAHKDQLKHLKALKSIREISLN